MGGKILGILIVRQWRMAEEEVVDKIERLLTA